MAEPPSPQALCVEPDGQQHQRRAAEGATEQLTAATTAVEETPPPPMPGSAVGAAGTESPLTFDSGASAGFVGTGVSAIPEPAPIVHVPFAASVVDGSNESLLLKPPGPSPAPDVSSSPLLPGTQTRLAGQQQQQPQPPQTPMQPECRPPPSHCPLPMPSFSAAASSGYAVQTGYGSPVATGYIAPPNSYAAVGYGSSTTGYGSLTTGYGVPYGHGYGRYGFPSAGYGAPTGYGVQALAGFGAAAQWPSSFLPEHHQQQQWYQHQMAAHPHASLPPPHEQKFQQQAAWGAWHGTQQQGYSGAWSQPAPVGTPPPLQIKLPELKPPPSADRLILLPRLMDAFPRSVSCGSCPCTLSRGHG